MYTANTAKRGSSKIGRLMIAVLLLVVIGGGAWLFLRQSKPVATPVEYPKYLSFAGNYVFSVPKMYTIDDQSLPGVQLLYKDKITVSSLSDAYNANAIAIQSIADLSDKKGDAFKKKINDAFVPELKKISSDTKVKFESSGGMDIARIVVTKEGKPVRFVFIRNGKHPVQIVAKEESDVVKAVEQTIIDVETSELKAETGPVGQVVDGVAKLIKDQKAAELYQQLAPEFKAKSSEADLKNTLEKAAPYTKGDFIISGAAYRVNPSEFTVVFSIRPPTKEAKATSGVLFLSKSSGTWKVKGLNLPTPNETAPATTPL